MNVSYSHTGCQNNDHSPCSLHGMSEPGLLSWLFMGIRGVGLQSDNANKADNCMPCDSSPLIVSSQSAQAYADQLVELFKGALKSR